MSDAVWDDACRQAALSAYRGVVDALRANVIHGDGRLYNPAGHNPLMMRAADLLEEAGVELTLREESRALAAARAKGLNDPPTSIDGALTPTGAAKMLVTVYGHPNWKPTGLEEMALLVARTFLAQQEIANG